MTTPKRWRDLCSAVELALGHTQSRKLRLIFEVLPQAALNEPLPPHSQISLIMLPLGKPAPNTRSVEIHAQDLGLCYSEGSNRRSKNLFASDSQMLHTEGLSHLSACKAKLHMSEPENAILNNVSMPTVEYLDLP